MNFNMEIPGLKVVIIEKIEEVGETFGASHSHNSDTILTVKIDTKENSPSIEKSVEGLFLSWYMQLL